MKTTISVISLIISIAIISYIVMKVVGLTTTYIIGLIAALFLAFLSGFAMSQIESIKTNNQGFFQNLKTEFERGKKVVTEQVRASEASA